MALVDIIVVGGGPAGLEAALTASRIKRTVKVFDSSQYRNNPQGIDDARAHTILLADHMRLSEFRAKAWEGINKYGVAELVKRKVVHARKHQDGLFSVEDDKGETHRGRKIILATGMVDPLPPIPGFEDIWGVSSNGCPFCSGHEQTDKVIGAWQPMIPLAVAIYGTWSTLTKHPLYLFTNGAQIPPMTTEALDSLLAHGHHLIEDEVERVERIGAVDSKDPKIRFHFKTGRQPLEIGWLVYGGPPQHRAPTLFEELGVELDDFGNAKVNGLFMDTNVEGVFAAGDISNMSKHVPQAIADGNHAGAGAAKELTSEDLKLKLPPGDLFAQAMDMFKAMRKGGGPPKLQANGPTTDTAPAPNGVSNGVKVDKVEDGAKA